MARVAYSAAALDDLDRIVELLLKRSPRAAATALGQIRNAIDILARYLALYRFDASPDVVAIARIRHQREAGYRD